MTQPPVPRKALVDSDYLSYRIGFASNGEPEALAKARLTEYLNELLFSKLDVDDYRLYLTGKGNFRDEVAVTQKYKGNRDGFVRPEHYTALRQHMIDKYDAVVVDGIEADDAVATESMSGEWIIVAVDKDLLQLVGHNYNPVKNEWCYIDEFTGLYNFYTQMLTGDRSDHIPCLKGIGPKKAEKILKDCRDEQSLAEAVWKAYQAHEHGIDYYIEQGTLLWLQRTPGEVWKPFHTITMSQSTSSSTS